MPIADPIELGQSKDLAVSLGLASNGYVDPLDLLAQKLCQPQVPIDGLTQAIGQRDPPEVWDVPLAEDIPIWKPETVMSTNLVVRWAPLGFWSSLWL